MPDDYCLITSSELFSWYFQTRTVQRHLNFKVLRNGKLNREESKIPLEQKQSNLTARTRLFY